MRKTKKVYSILKLILAHNVLDLYVFAKYFGYTGLLNAGSQKAFTLTSVIQELFFWKKQPINDCKLSKYYDHYFKLTQIFRTIYPKGGTFLKNQKKENQTIIFKTQAA